MCSLKPLSNVIVEGERGPEGGDDYQHTQFGSRIGNGLLHLSFQWLAEPFKAILGSRHSIVQILSSPEGSPPTVGRGLKSHRFFMSNTKLMGGETNRLLAPDDGVGRCHAEVGVGPARLAECLPILSTPPAFQSNNGMLKRCFPFSLVTLSRHAVNDREFGLDPRNVFSWKRLGFQWMQVTSQK